MLHNGASSSQPTTSFYWAYQNDQAGNGQAYELSAPGPWGAVSAELAFQLEGDRIPDTNVPEPGSLLLIAPALAFFALRRNRRNA